MGKLVKLETDELQVPCACCGGMEHDASTIKIGKKYIMICIECHKTAIKEIKSSAKLFDAHLAKMPDARCLTFPKFQ